MNDICDCSFLTLFLTKLETICWGLKRLNIRKLKKKCNSKDLNLENAFYASHFPKKRKIYIFTHIHM